jgi:hypothetical protein
MPSGSCVRMNVVLKKKMRRSIAMSAMDAVGITDCVWTRRRILTWRPRSSA